MEKKNAARIRHENLIKALNTAQRGKYKLKSKQTFSSDFENLDTNDINAGVGLFVDFNHLSGGSVGGFDLYKLLQDYFHDPIKREKINEIIK